ncbi:MAG: metal-dependent hydrolase [Microthrixaceae bacterium]|nr:metal-dependent hydrolase [Microthrixaceae bacterium]
MGAPSGPSRAEPPRHRRVSFRFGDSVDANWHRALPEFAAAANAVSLMMPYVEPFVIRSMRDQLPHLDRLADPLLAAQARAYIAQEAQHQAQHRRFNESIRAQVRGVGRLERLLDWTYRTLWERSSDRFRLAFATASESAAYGVARWVERRHAELFTGADPKVAALYLWHLAEEVEHKSVAFDVYDARHRSRRPLAAAMVLSVILLAAFTVAGTVVGLIHQRRLFNPFAVMHLVVWGFGFAFSELPNMFASVLPGHHPSEFVDPTFFELYLLDIESRAAA